MNIIIQFKESYIKILIMYLPVKFLDLDKSKTDNDVVKNINAKSIL